MGTNGVYKKRCSDQINKEGVAIKSRKLKVAGIIALCVTTILCNGISAAAIENFSVKQEVNLTSESVSLVGDMEYSFYLESPLASDWYVSCPYGGYSGHKGIDMATSYGSKVMASEDGVVISARHSNVSYGNCILIRHDNGYVTRYAHLSKILVSEGETVSKGEVIGKVGSTGNSTGPHLHFEVIKNGVAQNPYYVTQR